MTDARRTAAAVLSAALVAVGATACQAPGPSGAAAEAATYECLGDTIPAAALADAVTADAATGTARTAIDEAVWDDESPLELGEQRDWLVVEESDDRVVLLRELTGEQKEMGARGDRGLAGSDHQRIALEWVDAVNLGPAWIVVADGFCPLTVQLDGLEVPTVQLDPGALPSPDDTEIHLWVTETACASGQTAEGLIELVALTETADTVAVTIGVRERTGDQTCPSNPPTPYTVTLDGPLGDRTVVDGTRGVEMSIG